VAEGVCLLLPGNLDALLGDEGPGHAGADDVAFVHRVGLDHGEDIILDELVLRIDGVVLVRDQLGLLCRGLDLLGGLAHVDGDRDDLVKAIVLLQQGYAHGGIQASGIR
jgi:hypothetical protein